MFNVLCAQFLLDYRSNNKVKTLSATQPIEWGEVDQLFLFIGAEISISCGPRALLLLTQSRSATLRSQYRYLLSLNNRFLALPFIDPETSSLIDEYLVPQHTFFRTELTLCVLDRSYYEITLFMR
jgi:hypothetical protein